MCLQGFERAAAAGVKEVAVFPAATEAFSQGNLNASIADVLARFKDIVVAAQEQDIAVRGYVSCALGCPFQVRGRDMLLGSNNCRVIYRIQKHTFYCDVVWSEVLSHP